MPGGTVNLPAVGPVSRRALLIGGGLSVVVVGVVWWRRRQAAAAAAPAPADATDATDSGIGDLSGVGSGGGSGGSGSSTSSSTNFTSNPQWSAAVRDLLGGTIDPAALSQAIGLYLVGAAVNHDQELIIDQAIAAAGYPPVSGPNGYPPAIRQSPATGQTPPPASKPLPYDGTPANPSFRVTAGSNVDGWINALQAHGVRVVWSDLTRLNPGIANNIRNPKGKNGPHQLNTFVNAASYKLPPQPAP